MIYFSLNGNTYNMGNVSTGNTEVIANYIEGSYGIKSYKIVASETYPEEFEEIFAVGIREKYLDIRPKIKYDVTGLQ